MGFCSQLRIPGYEIVIIGTHTCAPVLVALTIDSLRLRKGRQRLFPAKHLIAIGLAGALPDLLHPHLALNARYSSWTHTVWFLIALYPIFLTICRAWFKPREFLQTNFMWLATVGHLATDTIAKGKVHAALSGCHSNKGRKDCSRGCVRG
jgi:hypothetical protein